MSQFEQLPLEIRLIIYGYAAFEGAAVTIGAARLTGKRPELVQRQYGGKRSPLQGLPSLHEAVIFDGYSSRLLSVENVARIHVSQAPKPQCYLDTDYHSTLGSLLLLNRQTHDELTTHFNVKNNRKTSCFVNFPLGLHVLKSKCPDLVRQAKSLHIAGSSVGPPSDSSNTELAALIRTVMVKPHDSQIAKLEVRIFFSGSDTRVTVWEDNSPLSVILRNVNDGYINLEVTSGRNGTGVYVSVRPHPEGKRCLSTVWRRFEDEEIGDWVVDADWPEWKEEYVASPPSTPY